MAAYSTAVLQCSRCITIIATGEEKYTARAAEARLGRAGHKTRVKFNLLVITAGEGLRSGYRREGKLV